MECTHIRCLNCTDHFHQLKPHIKEIIISHHFKKDAPDFDTDLITGCSHDNFTKLHKFEKTIHGHHIFRALKEKIHYVYAIDKDYRLVFLRAFHNYAKYSTFLNYHNAILNTISTSM
jgi:hypothetical protein